MLELKRTELKVKLDGNVHSLRKPTVVEVEGLNLKIDKLEKNSVESFKLMKSFVSEMGMPEDVIDGMETDQFVTLVEYITGSKKN